MKAKIELTTEALKAVIDEKHPSSLTRLSHEFGYKGSVSGSLAKKFRALLPGIDSMLQGTGTSSGKPEGNGKSKVTKNVTKDKTAKGANLAGAKGKYLRDSRNPYRPGSYATCYDILAHHQDGLAREKLIELLSRETGKDLKRASFDAQVVLSAHPNDDGLSNNDSPRHRSCRPGFWIKRTNNHVQLMT